MAKLKEEVKGILDELDLEIINLLKLNAKMKMQDIGDQVHLTGQAVSNRIAKLEKMGVIKGYSVIVDKRSELTAFVTVFMKTADHIAFKKFLDHKKEIIEAHRISGEGCYLLKAETTSQEKLTQLLDEVLYYGNYKVNISIGQIK